MVSTPRTLEVRIEPKPDAKSLTELMEHLATDAFRQGFQAGVEYAEHMKQQPNGADS